MKRSKFKKNQKSVKVLGIFLCLVVCLLLAGCINRERSRNNAFYFYEIPEGVYDSCGQKMIPKYFVFDEEGLFYGYGVR